MLLIRFLLCLIVALPGASYAQAAEAAGAADVARPDAAGTQDGETTLARVDTNSGVVMRRNWTARVMRAAQRLYQEGPLESGLSGTVQVRFISDGSASASDCIVWRSSGFSALDALGCQAVGQIDFPPVVLDSAGAPTRQYFILPLQFVDGDSLAPARGDGNELEEGAP